MKLVICEGTASLFSEEDCLILRIKSKDDTLTVSHVDGDVITDVKVNHSVEVKHEME